MSSSGSANGRSTSSSGCSLSRVCMRALAASNSVAARSTRWPTSSSARKRLPAVGDARGSGARAGRDERVS
ncbi:hypothetical protein PF010_g32100 [Phytophthora fragariae]|uniref:Uncharacterized protein n=1 Tax=Phytophthora fragariae TaxID=53985 RepID=A0A6A3PBI2_9STRA|nr:hypothetical protein PF010_g32100 [Phytophthora fragariae]KAE9057067.1 hypothetical protein PF007_g31772 [Phytophthora fragariae]KAE9158653.1 hypothetical protein PF004_g31806 [Phytophthora fragariae]KAE9165325.1 hypothetical protein PF002_g31384 [Phytophthora fragariae]KAE9264196.1 hypothetical protein PF008_g32173 [Phytophthora fragariae]